MDKFQEFIGIDFWTALFILLNTLTVFFVAKKFLFVPVNKMITDRQKEIDDMYADAAKAKNDAQAMSDVKEAVIRGQNREEEIVRQANAEAQAILTKASADIELEKKKAVNDAKNEISEMAMAVAVKVIGRELNDTDQSDLVDHFIDELGDEA